MDSNKLVSNGTQLTDSVPATPVVICEASPVVSLSLLPPPPLLHPSSSVQYKTGRDKHSHCLCLVFLSHTLLEENGKDYGLSKTYVILKGLDG